MRIAQLAKKYGIEKRTVDYYTTLGLIPYTVESGSNYRDYGPDAETVVKKILILRDVGMPEKKIKEALNSSSYFTTAMWNAHIATLQRKIEETQKHYQEMIQFAMDLRDSGSLALRLIERLDLESARVLSRIWSKANEYFNEDKLLDLSESLPEDVSRILNDIYVFIKSAEKKKNAGVAYSAPEVQSLISRLYNSFKELYGWGVYLAYQIVKDERPEIFGINVHDEEDVEIFRIFMDAFGICADWCHDARTVDTIRDFDAFHQAYKDRIDALNHALEAADVKEESEDNSFSFLTELLEEICSIPSRITPEMIDEWEKGYSLGVDAGIEMVQEKAKESHEIIEVERDRELEQYVFAAIKHFVTCLHRTEEKLDVSGKE